MPTIEAEPRVHATRLETNRLILRPLTPADAPAIQRLAGAWEVARYTAQIPHPYPEGAAAQWIGALSEADEVVLGIERRRDAAFLGCCGYTLEADASAEIGYWIGRPHWGKGYATEAVERLVAHLFADRGVNRVTATALPENRASIRVQEKLGFAYAGTREMEMPARGSRRTLEARALDRDRWAPRRRIVLVAAVALIDPDGRVLLAQRPEGKPMAGLWEFPGGKVQDGETPEAALIRELREELDIDVTDSCLAPFTFASHAYADFHLLMPLYVCRKWRGQVRALEGQALAWVRPSRLGDYPMPPADKPLIPMLQDLL